MSRSCRSIILRNGLTACLLIGVSAGVTATYASAQSILESRVYVSGFVAPVGFEQDPDDARVQFVVQQGGVIRTIVDGVLQATPFLDLSATVAAYGEAGLLGLAFPPDTATTRRFYVHFNTLEDPPLPDGTIIVSRVARFTRSAFNPLIANPSSRRDLVWSTGEPFIRHPFGNHKGGQIAFGPDGYLYIAMGDGGSGNDPAHHAQNPQSLLGKLMRLDVDVPDTDPEGFDIPPTNPFVDGIPVAARPEIWAFGMRNPWRFSFDSLALGGSGALLVADVGQSQREEINYEPPRSGGRNYGWRNYEGTRLNEFHDTLPLAFGPKTDPIFEYPRSDGYSVTGGFVYRGSSLGAAYRGRYFFGDFGSGRIWSLGLAIDGSGEASTIDRMEHTAAIAGTQAIGSISSFGQDAGGELYVVSYFGGTVFRIGPRPLSKPQLTSPITGTVGMTPTYRWRPVQTATAYQLWVNDSSGTVVDTWYNAASLACGIDCWVSPRVALAEGSVTWWVRGWNVDGGEGPWSDGASIVRSTPGPATLVAPSGVLGPGSPRFEWTPVGNATHYYLWVNDRSGQRLDRWYSAGEAGCAIGVSRCSVDPRILLVEEGLWWVQAWSATHGYGPWSAGLMFTRAPLAAPALISPATAVAAAATEFRWSAVAGATHYYLWVNDAAGPRIQTWYMSGAAKCANAPTVCSLPVSLATLGSGTATWWVQAWSLESGFSRWSAGLAFSR